MIRSLTKLVKQQKGIRSLSKATGFQVKREDELYEAPEFDSLTGDPTRDGLDRYELDFVETGEWTKRLLTAMQEDVEKLAGMHRPFSKRIDKGVEVSVGTTDYFTYDFSKHGREATTVSMALGLAGLRTEANKDKLHKLLLLTSDQYDAVLDVVTLTETVEAQDSVSPSNDRLQCLKTLDNRWNRLLEESGFTGQTSDTFTDIPVDLTHQRPSLSEMGRLEFPREWVRQSVSE